MAERQPPSDLGRRRLLGTLSLGPLGLMLPRQATAKLDSERSLEFLHTHTGEHLRVVYFAGGKYVRESLERVDRLLRDFRTGAVHSFDRQLLDTLAAVRALCGGGRFEVIAGFRSPETNAMLRRASNGVARNSLHMEARAIDVRLTGIATVRLRDAALALAAGGVGYYPGADFVHLDTGRVRSWGGRAA